MGDKNWMPDFDFEFPEIIEERESYVDKCSHIKEVAILPNDLTILPFEWMTLQITGSSTKKMFDEVEKDEVYLGVGFQEKGEKALPAVGSIGVGADIVKLDKKTLRDTYIVEIRGVVRFIIDEYLDTDKPYPVARITFFEDVRAKNEAERKMRPGLYRELKELVGKYNRRLGKYRHMDGFGETLENKHLEAYSFFFWVCFAPVPMEIRKVLLESRSTVQRTYLLNQQMKRFLKRVEKTKPAASN